ncbi:MAG: hypothetical protein ABR953_02585 [Candidatus Acidiferrales bacterium]|jgi:hypothetical protein
MLKGCAVAVMVLLGALRGIAQTQTPAQTTAPATHSVTVKFDYDFRFTPPCTKKIKARCVQQFVVYDISVGEAKRTKLFTIPTPEHAKKSSVAVTGTSPQLVFESGQHLLEVVAQYPDGTESQKRACTTWITIP